jgi:hypothetical protein
MQLLVFGAAGSRQLAGEISIFGTEFKHDSLRAFARSLLK